MDFEEINDIRTRGSLGANDYAKVER